MTIPASQTYLTDVEFWFKVDFPGLAQGEWIFTITEMCKLIKSISVWVDSRQILYLDYAKYLLSILNQRKGEDSQQLNPKIYDRPFQFNWTFTAAAADNFGGYATQDHHLAKWILKPKQWSLYRHLGELAHNYVNLNICTDDQNTALVNEQSWGNNMLTQPDLRFCLFKLSDLGLFKSFPVYLLKRGFEITLELSTSHALQNVYPQEEAKQAAD